MIPKIKLTTMRAADIGKRQVVSAFWTGLVGLPLLGCGQDEVVLTHSSPQGAGGEGGAACESGNEAGAGGESEQHSVALDGLVVSGVAASLYPAFSPDIQRYSVREAAPRAALVVTAMAAPELEIEIDGHPAKSGMPETLEGLSPGAEVNIRLENSAGSSRTYTVVYLPHEFPDLEVTTRKPGASSDPIYVALKYALGENYAGIYYLAKLDSRGVPLFFRKIEQTAFDFKKGPCGSYSYAERIDNTRVWSNVVLDANFDEVTRVSAVGEPRTDSHEFHILPNGNYIVVGYQESFRDLTEFGKTANTRVLDMVLQELSPERELLFEWNSWDHLPYGESVYHKSETDYSHLNSVFVANDGNWIVSSRGMAQVFKVDRSTGEIIWRLGGMANEFTFVNDPYGGLCGQHTATLVEHGNLLVFDNGQSCYPEMPERGELTRIAEFALDEQEMTAELVWSFSREGAYTESQGSAQRLPNGNTFIGWGYVTPFLATEVDRDGNIVFELEAHSPEGDVTSYRAYRFPD